MLRAEDVAEELLAQMDTIFEHIDRSRIETGLLSDYGCFFSDPSLYDGTLDEDNWVTLHDWQMLYASMYASQVNDKVSLEKPSSVFEEMAYTPSFLYLQYNEIDTTAFDRGLLSVVDDQLYESGSESPYLTKELFAATFPDAEYEKRLDLVFSESDYISNVDELPALSVRFQGETAWHEVDWGMPFSLTFSSGGEKEVAFRLTFKDGKTMESHTKIRIEGESSRHETPENTVADTIIPINSTAKHSGGEIQIKYANFNTTGKLVRPLIVADEMDLSAYNLGPDVNLDYVVDKLADLSEGSSEEFDISDLFDLVYVNDSNGLDDINRNAILFQEALMKINNLRHTFHDQSYVIGLGMGGLVANCALIELERLTSYSHDVQKLITINSPHKGMNFPLGIQAVLKHLSIIYYEGAPVAPQEVLHFAELFDQPAIRQMLTYNIGNDLEYENDNFMFLYRMKGLPIRCESVAISTGSQSGYPLFGTIPLESDLLFELEYKAKKRAKYIATGRLLQQKTETQLYTGRVRILRHDEKTRSLYSTESMLGLDIAPGSYFPVSDLPLKMGEIDLTGAFKVDKFCLIPTVSALGIGNWDDRLFSELDLETENTMFDRIYASQDNSSYMDWSGCKDALLYELVPRIEVEGDSRQLLGETAFSLVNVPSMLPFTWSSTNGHFKTVSQPGTQAVIVPLHFNVSDQLNASVSLPGITSFSYSTEVRNSVSIEGEPYITSVKSRYGLNPMPEDVTVDWRVSENVGIDEEHNDYAIAHLKNVQDGTWIEAVVTTPYGTESVIRKDLFSNNITSITMTEYDKPWWEDNRKHYIFYVDYEPRDIPIDQLTFCWSNTVQIDGGLMTRFTGIADMETEGTVGICRPILNDSIIKRPPIVIGDGFPVISPTFNNDKPDPIDPIDPPKFYPTGVNYCEVIMPAIDTDESASGQVRCMVSDNNGKILSVSYNVSVEYYPVYHTAPNPADTELIVTKEATNGSAVVSTFSMEPEEVTLQLYNDFGMVWRKTVDISSGEARMNTAALPEGTYYLHILKGDKVIGRKIVFIEH